MVKKIPEITQKTLDALLFRILQYKQKELIGLHHKMEGDKRMNKVLLVGRLVNDPRFTTGKSSGATFATLACEGEFNRSKGKKEVDFIDITIFGKQAEFVANYTRKGDLISVEGALKNSDYMKDGKKVYKTSVIVSKVDKLASVKGGDSN